MTWKSPEELTWVTKDFTLHPSFLSLLIDPPRAGKQWLEHFHQVVSLLDNSFLYPLSSLHRFSLSSSITTLFNELQIQHVLHPPLILTSALALIYAFDTSSILSVPLPPAASQPPGAPYQSAPPSPPCDICHLFSFCSSSNVSLCLTIFTFLTVTRFRCCISLWSTHISSWCITEHYGVSASASNQHHCQNIVNLSSRLRLFCTKKLVKHQFRFCPVINRPF